MTSNRETREQMMLRLRARYSEQRGQKSIEKVAPLKPEKVKPIIINTKRRIDIRARLKPYLFLVENDVRKVFGLRQKEWKVGGMKFETVNKPLNLDWLKKNGGKF